MTRIALKKAISQLSNYQIDKIQSIVLDYLFLNHELENMRPEFCPKCGANGFLLIKKGFSRGKQRFQCKCCQKKFTHDTLQITSYSHQPLEAWITALEATLRLDSLEETARLVGVCRSTAFYMRHKLLAFMEQALDAGEALDVLIEADETYVPVSQKGRKVTHREPRSHGEGVDLRGISHKQLCVCVATDRNHHVAARCVNRGRPTGKNIEEAIGQRIAEEAVFQCDGIATYDHNAYRSEYHNALDSLVETYFGSGRFDREIRELHEMLLPYVEKDPTAFYTAEEFSTGCEVLRPFCERRALSVRLQLDGKLSAIDADQPEQDKVPACDLNVMDMGAFIDKLP